MVTSQIKPVTLAVVLLFFAVARFLQTAVSDIHSQQNRMYCYQATPSYSSYKHTLVRAFKDALPLDLHKKTALASYIVQLAA